MAKETPRRAAEILYDVDAVGLSVQPMIFQGGLRSPVYCDCRLLMGYVEQRKEVVQMLTAEVRSLGFEVELIAATATGGIAPGAWVADRLDLPMAYVRGQAKVHGKGNQVEGIAPANVMAVVIEDLVTTAESSLRTVEALRAQGVIVADIVSIFEYGLPLAASNLEQAGVQLRALTNLVAWIEVALEVGDLSEAQADTLRRWRASPEAY